MSRLESQSQPILQPLLAGTPTFLAPDAQAIVALWATKTAMVLEGLGPMDQRVYTDAERRQLRALSVIPRRSSVWLSASIDRAVFMSTKTRHFNESIDDEPSGACTTIGLSHLVFQVLTIRIPQEVPHAAVVTTDVRVGPWSEVTVRVWPHTVGTVSWPPPMGLDGEPGLDALADRFTTRVLAAAELQSLAI
jgi:hypothetical protein